MKRNLIEVREHTKVDEDSQKAIILGYTKEGLIQALVTTDKAGYVLRIEIIDLDFSSN